MNAIMDLTARAASFITAIQTILLKGAINSKREQQKISILSINPKDFEPLLREFIQLEESIISGEFKKSEQENFSIRAEELVWTSAKAPDRHIAVEYTIKLCVALTEWIWDGENKKVIDAMLMPFGRYPSPFKWREVINHILYDWPNERIKLAAALQYLPIQVILALGGGKYGAREQRILQMWMVTDEDRRLLLNDDENRLLDKLTLLEQQTETDAASLLKDDEKLCNYLIKSGSPLPFEYVFTGELEEISKNRIRRAKEKSITDPPATDNQNGNGIATVASTQTAGIREVEHDPFEKGKQLALYALAFSGGGIRSATFNLGILQGLAQKALISRFDYLSTVSGGGYIGSWLAAWIKREGSVVKVTNRLNPDKSPNPLGEELRPIKWLRMFSNYFAPKASIMSVDSWTIGITWLRNTLLNQIVIFLMLLALLFAGNLLYVVWLSDIKASSMLANPSHVIGWSLVLLLPVSILAGLGMHAYHSEGIRWLKVKRENTTRISGFILLVALMGAYLISGWLSSPWDISDGTYDKIKIFIPAALVAFVCLCMVAALGKYVNCIKSFKKSTGFAWFILLFTAAITTVIGLLCLSFAWTILEKIDNASSSYVLLYKNELEFIFGMPLILEVFSITLVARMALLGKYFPDERREWWGRMGALVHRIAFLWMLIAASALLGQDFIKRIFTLWWAGIAATGGWMALVAATVRAAFSSKTSGKKESKSSLSSFLNILGLIGPYLFALGLLILLPGLIRPLVNLENKLIKDLNLPTIPYYELQVLFAGIICALAAFLLARQIGVNEFSMHHFYRNRLVRAYLGATRRSADRQRTFNPFTGFDMMDDEKLAKMKNEFGYYGPYPILNTALNASQVTDLDRQDRKAESFIFSPLYCGFDFSMIKPAADVKSKSYDYAYRQTKNYAYKDNGPSIGTAMAISGAAINPNQGYHSSAATAFLLTVFNVQMGWWIGNPRKSTWQSSDPKFGLGYIMNNLVGKTNTRNDFVALSDGGHFDNMGLYEMIRRKCKFIMLCDAEQDNKFTCEGLANAIRRCRIDFGADIKIDISKIITRTEDRLSQQHYAIGAITYADETEPTGILLYIKSSITGDEPVDVQEYAAKNTTFPHQTTADQFFDEEQFESYRRLGLHIINVVLKDATAAKLLGLKQETTTENMAANKYFPHYYEKQFLSEEL